MKLSLSNPITVDITCKRGDTFTIDSLRFWQDADKTIPLDITSYTFKMEVRNAANEVVLLFDMSSGFTISDTNLLEIKKEATDMEIDASPVGQPYVYDLQMTDDVLYVSTIMKGYFVVTQDVTQNA